MSSKSTKRSFAFPAVFVLSIALAGADLVVSAQDNQNNNNAEMQTSNMSNANTSGRRKGSRRGSKRASANANANTTSEATANTNAAAGQENANTGTENTNTAAGTTSTGRSKKGRGRKSSASAGSTAAQAGATTAGGQSTDLSGTYTGVVNYPEGNLSGPATLSITGNQFTLTPDGGSPVSGRVSAVSTRGYTGVAMQIGNFASATPGQPAGPPPVSVSVRAKKTGNNLSLTSAPNAKPAFSFTPTGRSGGKKGRKTSTPAAEATPTTGATEATTTAGATETTTAPKTSGRKGRRGSRGKANTNTNAANTNTGETNTNNSNQ